MELREFFNIIKKRLWILISITLLCTITSGLVSFYVLSPVYQSNTTLYVFKKIDAQGNISYNDLLMGAQLVKDYHELVKSRLISSTVIQELDLQNMTTEEISKKINVSLKSDTRVIEITAEDTNPEKAKNIANKVAEVFQQKVVELMDVENVQIIDKAEMPIEPVKPKKLVNIVIGTFLGLMVGLGLIFLLEYLDNTIKTKEDVQDSLDLPVIGVVPAFPK